jgi:hypothetical protein
MAFSFLTGTLEVSNLDAQSDDLFSIEETIREAVHNALMDAGYSKASVNLIKVETDDLGDDEDEEEDDTLAE